MCLRRWSIIYIIVFSILIAGTIGGNRIVQSVYSVQPLAHQVTVVIDAGHGGIDGGAVSCTGVFESKINLEIALKLNDLFRFLGCNTVMIRDSDISVYTTGNTIAQKKMSDLKERVRIISETNNAFLLSIHQNKFQESKYSGAQVFYADTQGSKDAAELLQENLRKTINKSSNRMIKKASGIYIMEHIQCQAILVECGFLSNPVEEAKLRNDNYQKQLCCVIAASIASFISNT